MDDVIKILDIINKKGLHARATAKFVKTAASFDASVKVCKIDAKTSEMSDPVTGSSILGLMMLGAEPGSKIHVTASGPQATEVAEALEKLVNEKFGED